MRNLTRLAASVVFAAFSAGVTRATAASLQLVPSASLREEYDDNINFTRNGTDDYVTSIGVGTALHYRGQRLSVSASGASSAQVFARSTSQNRVFSQQVAGLQGAYRASPRFQLAVTDSLSRVERARTTVGGSTAPPAAGQQPGPTTAVNTLLPSGQALSNFFGLQGSYALAPRWTASGFYRNSFDDFNSPSGHDLTNRLGASLGYAWTPTLSFNATYSYSRLEFTGQAATDTESHAISVGGSYQPAAEWSVDASAGLYVNRPLQSQSDSRSDSVGPTFDVSLERRTENGAFLLSGSQQITTSAGVAGVSTTRSASGTYERFLWRSLTGSTGIRYDDFSASHNSFDILEVYANLSAPVGRYLTAGFEYSYRRRDAAASTARIEQGVVDGNLVSVFVSASYPVWRGSL